MLKEAALLWRFARRDLRGGAVGLSVLIGCLALGVAAIGGIGSLSAGIRANLAAEARTLLGGDISIRRTYEALTPDIRDWVVARAETTSDSVEMRAMAAAPDGARALVELKAVDDAWPLYGEVALTPAQPLAEALADRGAVAEPALLDRLGLAVGETLVVGDSTFVLRGIVEHEPDRIASAFSFGPRLMVAATALPETGLLRRGALIRHFLKLKLAPGVAAGDFAHDLEAAFPLADWRVRRPDQAQSGLRDFIDQLDLYLTLIGLTVLLVGGVGVASAAQSHVSSRLGTLATLKCLGATPATAFRLVMLGTALLALCGIVIGVAAGAALPWAAGPSIAARLDVAPATGVYPLPLALAALYGALTAALFSLWPLARASRVSAGGLFRHAVAMPDAPPPPAYRIAAAALVVLLAVVVFVASDDRIVAAWFVGGAAGSMTILALAGRGAARTARQLAHRCRGTLRLALASLGRPGAATAQTVCALGVGLSVLVAVMLVESNMRRMVDERLREDAPAFFFIDVQRDQAEPLAALIDSFPEVDGLDRAPMLRGRLTAINGKPIEVSDLPPDARWLARGDIGLSFAALPPARAEIVEGEWWPADYDGPPLISFDEESARSAGFEVGDRVTFSVLGRAIEATIGNFRRVSWNRIGINFVVVYAPGVLDAAPWTLVASARASEAAEGPLIRALGENFANVSAIPVRALLAAVGQVVSAVAAAIGLTASTALLAGVMVLAGAVAAGRRARLHDAVVLKVLGATRARLLGVWLLEFALLGLIAGGVALVAGGLAAWGFVSGILEIDWQFPAGRAFATVSIGAAVAAVFGFAGTWRALGRKPARVLRTP